MNIIRRRRPETRNYSANQYDRQRLREVAEERCGLCMDRWPASMMTDEDGYRRCPDCLAIRTEEVKARNAEHDALQKALRQTRPQVSRVPMRETVPHIRIMEDGGGTRVVQGSPIVMVRSGAAVTLVITGGGFSSSDTFSYSTGISDSSAASLSGTTEWTLTLAADGTASPGDNHLTFNDHTYRGILRVA